MEQKIWVPFVHINFYWIFSICFFYCNMLSISCHVYYKLMLLFYLCFLLLLSRQTSTRNTSCKSIPLMNYRRIIMKCSSVFDRWRIRVIETTVHAICRWSLVESSQKISLIFFVFRVNCLCCGWAVNLSFSSFPSLQYCWKQQDWYGPSSWRGYKALGALSFSLHVMLHRLSFLECMLKWVTQSADMRRKYSKKTSESRMSSCGDWSASCCHTVYLLFNVCLVMLFECLVGWNPVM